jgi:hypothetical protein
MEIIDLIQTIAILVALLVTGVQLKRVRTSNRVNTYTSIISMMNNLRNLRINDTELEGLLFTGRKDMSQQEIKKRVYVVELANIFELAFLSRKVGLMEKSVWDEWIYLWQNIILTDESMATLLTDPTIYTFSRIEALDIIKKISKNKEYIVPDPYIGFFKELSYRK